MMWTSEVYVTKPTQYKTELEEKVYETLEELKNSLLSGRNGTFNLHGGLLSSK